MLSDDPVDIYRVAEEIISVYDDDEIDPVGLSGLEVAIQLVIFAAPKTGDLTLLSDPRQNLVIRVDRGCHDQLIRPLCRFESLDQMFRYRFPFDGKQYFLGQPGRLFSDGKKDRRLSSGHTPSFLKNP
jgi:hypothetical protein